MEYTEQEVVASCQCATNSAMTMNLKEWLTKEAIFHVLIQAYHHEDNVQPLQVQRV